VLVWLFAAGGRAAPHVIDQGPTDPEVAQFDTTPSPLPPALAARAFESHGLSEIGDLVRLDGKSHGIDRATVTLSSTALRTEHPGSAAGGFLHPIALKIFSVDRRSGTPQPGEQLAMVTQPFLIPWQPAPESGSRLWRASDGRLHAGIVFNVAFDLTGTAAILPDEIIFRVGFSTQHHGPTPLGTPGPYDFLGVAEINPAPPVRFTSSAYGTLSATAVLLRQTHATEAKAEAALREAATLVGGALNRKLWNGRHRLNVPAGILIFELLSETADQLAELARAHPTLALVAHRTIGGLMNTAETVTAAAATDAHRADVRFINRAKAAIIEAGHSEQQRKFGEAIEQLGDAWRILQIAAP
jgi:hypothetical protein